MAVWKIVVIIACILNLVMAAGAYLAAENKDRDPMSAFMATVFFGLIGLLLVLNMRDRKEIKNMDKEEIKKSNASGDAIIFFSQEDKMFRMKLNNYIVDSHDERHILTSDKISCFFQDENGWLHSMSNLKAYKYLSPNWK